MAQLDEGVEIDEDIGTSSSSAIEEWFGTGMGTALEATRARERRESITTEEVQVGRIGGLAIMDRPIATLVHT